MVTKKEKEDILKILEKYHNKINEYNKEIEKYNKILNTNYKFVINESNIKKLKNSSKLEGIIVGDNPGIEENKNKEYFIGNAGKNLENELNKVDTSKKKYLILNKTTLHTKKTEDLYKIYTNQYEKNTKKYNAKEKLKELFLKEQKTTTKLILKIYNRMYKNNNKTNLIIFGYSNYHNPKKPYKKYEKNKPAKKKPTYIFFNTLNEIYSNKKYKKLQQNILFFHHPSYNRLSIQLNKNKNYEMKPNKDTFEKIGQKNINKFFK